MTVNLSIAAAPFPWHPKGGTFAPVSQMKQTFVSPAVHCSEKFRIVAFAMLASFNSVWFVYLLVYSDHRLVSMTTFTFKICREHERHLQMRAFWGCSGSGRGALAIEMVFQVLLRYVGRLWLKLVISFQQEPFIMCPTCLHPSPRWISYKMSWSICLIE